MDKDTIFIVIIAGAIGGIGYGIVTTLQPVLLAAVNIAGVLLTLLVGSVCFGGLFVVVMLFMEKPALNNQSAGGILITRAIAEHLYKRQHQAAHQIQNKPWTANLPAEIVNLEYEHKDRWQL